jgi:galactose mutarotase-like enzyme
VRSGSDVVTLANGTLRVAVTTRGAELASLQREGNPAEYLWQGDPAFWKGRAPLLFPIVGALKNGSYTYRGATYHLPQHGFARDARFAVRSRSETHVALRLGDDDATRAVYPFGFSLTATYRLAGEVLGVELEVDNPSSDEMLFSLGGHPGFACPLEPHGRLEDHVVELEQEETTGRWPVVGGLIGEPAEPFLAGQRIIALHPGLFEHGALVLKGLRSRRVRLVRRGGGNGVELEMPGFPYLGIWSRPGAPFVCLEPWCGIADSTRATGRLEEKEGIVRLAPGGRFERAFSIRPF